MIDEINIWIVVYYNYNDVETWPIMRDMTQDEIILDLRESGNWDEDDDKEYEDGEIGFDIQGPFKIKLPDNDPSISPSFTNATAKI